MIYRNQVFKFERERFRHLLTVGDTAWVISLDDPKAWPVGVAWAEIRELEGLPLSADVTLHDGEATAAMLRVRDVALVKLGSLDAESTELFDPVKRSQWVTRRAQAVGCSKVSLWKYLRQWWVGGQTPAGLLPVFARCKTNQGKVTRGRGRPRRFGIPIYQVNDEDIQRFHEVVRTVYTRDGRIQIPDTYAALIDQYYQYADGNGELFSRPAGERPSIKQFRTFLKNAFTREELLRLRKGDKEFEREHRQKLGTVMEDCLGVGHYFEADATIADVYLVAANDIRKIIGKPTLYFIIDRYSRLIVGWYIGLENPSWACAKQAILSIVQDKAMLCASLGVEYDPEDWPAHQVFPKQILADLGEWMTLASMRISDDLEVTVANVPGQRPDWKPIAESAGFKLFRKRLEGGIPGYDPPENAKRRQGKHYDKDACLTLQEFSRIVLEYVIAHNRKPMKRYQRNFKEVGDNVMPTPIALWNHNIVDRAGQLTRYSEERVRHALLQRDTATFTDEGIQFKKLHYSCPEAVAGGWFVNARVSRFKVDVAYETRLVDTILVQHPHRSTELIECRLLPRCQRYAGKSFAEVAAIKLIDEAMTPAIEHERLDVSIRSKRKTEHIVDAAKRRLKEQGRGVKRHARRADTKPARARELTRERQATVLLSPAVPQDAPKAPVLQLRPIAIAAPDDAAPMTALQKAALEARQRILKG